MASPKEFHGSPIPSVTSYTANNGSTTLILGFAFFILIGTILLSLPIATETRESLTWREALFTATSAVTVTGLVVFSPVDTLSMFGELVVLALIQIGGIGFMIISVVLFRLIGRRVGLGERLILSQVLGVHQSHGVVRLTLMVVLVVAGIELLGAAFLFLAWWDVMGPAQAAYYAIFHSISAFCNAGFDLFHGTSDPWLLDSRRNPLVVFTLSILITIGTLGIVVIFDLLSFPKTKHLSLHSKLIIPLVLFLTMTGTFFLLLDELILGDVLSTMPQGERWLLSFFTVVSSRTAGITFVPIQELGQASQLVLLIFMFIGGAPASMGGGVGLTTVAVVLVTLYTNVRGDPDVRIFQRTLPSETIYKAVAIMTVSTALVVGVTLIIMLLSGDDFLVIAFEVVSAFSNTGYSLGLTAELSEFSRALIIFTMFWGRLGPLTLVVALAQRRRKTQIRFPKERIIIG